MSIVVSCQCGRSFKAKDEWSGRRAKCPGCGTPLIIPTPAAAVPPDELFHQPARTDEETYDIARAPAPRIRTSTVAIAATMPARPAPQPSRLAATGGRHIREWLYLALLLALVPLAWSTFASGDAERSISDRFERTVAHASEDARDTV